MVLNACNIQICVTYKDSWIYQKHIGLGVQLVNVSFLETFCLRKMLSFKFSSQMSLNSKKNDSMFNLESTRAISWQVTEGMFTCAVLIFCIYFYQSNISDVVPELYMNYM